MTGIPDEYVEKALTELHDRGFDVDRSWGDMIGAALEAIGLPALLERVEAAEALLRAIEDSRLDPARAIIKADRLAGEAIIKADALAAKVARVEALCDEEDANPEGIVITAGHSVYHMIESGRVRAALTANDTGVTLTPANAAQGNLAAPSTIPDDGDDA